MKRAGLLLLLVLAPTFAQDLPSFEWQAVLTAEQTLELRLINGTVRVEPADGAATEVSAWTAGDGPMLHFEAVQGAGGAVICALYPETTCAGKGSNGMVLNASTQAHFVVRVAAGVRLKFNIVNGRADIDVTDNRVDVNMVNGVVKVRTRTYAKVNLVNGTITGLMGDPSWSGGGEFRMVNGTIDLELAASANARVHSTSVIGAFTTDFPLTVKKRFIGHSVEGVLGSGGPALEMSTVSGNVRLRAVTQTTP